MRCKRDSNCGFRYIVQDSEDVLHVNSSAETDQQKVIMIMRVLDGILYKCSY